MTQLQCAVIKDLLPLYYDDVCSDETKKLVEEHTASCRECKMELESLNAPINIPMVEIQNRVQDEKVIRKLANSWSRVRKKALYKGMSITAIVCLLLFGGYYALFEWDIQPVSTDKFKISEISQLENGRIAYRIDFLDDYDVRRVKYNLDEKGNFYMTPLRPIIKIKSERPIGDANESFNIQGNEENWDNQEIKALYYGSPDDGVLLWEKGMELPKASDEMEFNFDRNNWRGE